MKDPVTFAPPAKLKQALDTTLGCFAPIVTTRSKSVTIPAHIRDKMRAFKLVQAYWSSPAGEKAYAGLIEEQRALSNPKTAAKPKTKTATG